MLETWESVVLMLENHGGWAVSVVLAFAIWRLWVRNNKREDERREDDHTQIKMLEGFKASVDALAKVVERLADKKHLTGEDQGD